MAAILRAPDIIFRHAYAERRRRFDTMRGGARQLLEGIEWEIERILHLGRGALWLAFYVLLLLGWNVSLGSMLASSTESMLSRFAGESVRLGVTLGGSIDVAITVMTFAGGATAWALYWLLLRASSAWRWLRFIVIVVDTLTVVRFALAASNAGDAFASFGMSRVQLAGTLPAAFMLLLFSGVLRLNPFTGVVAGLSAVVGQIATNRLLGLTTDELGAQVVLLALCVVLGMQFLFVLRQLGLKAAEEEVLERFVPQGLTQRIARAGGTIPARVVPVTILIADIRGFTTLSEPLAPKDAVALLNSFFATMVGPLAAEDAVLDKYLGDGLLAFVEGDFHASRGLRAAHNIVRAIDESNRGQEQPIRIGIAVHSAAAFVDSIGAPSQMEYTVIGDAVSVTSRLEGLMSSKAGAERIDAVLVASEDSITLARAEGVTVAHLQGPLQVAVHGRAQPMQVYYLPPLSMETTIAPEATIPTP